MKYTTLPNTDVKISRICLGTMTWGQQNNQAEGHQQMSYALDQGVNFFDTAELYSIPPRLETYGSTETIIGTWFKKTGNRHKVVLASKIAGPAPFTKHIRATGFDRNSIFGALEGSLKRLGTDYLDLYQLHWPERKTNFFGKRGYQYDPQDQWQDNIHQVLNTLKELIDSGKVRHVGLSNETPWGTMEFLRLSQQHDLPRMITIQNPYSLLNRLFEVGLAEISMREKIKLLAYSPMGFGTLSGKFLNGQMPANSRIALFPTYRRYLNDNAMSATAKYAALADEFGVSFAQMSLSFVTGRPFVASTIIGATSMEQLRENISSINLELDPGLIRKLEIIHEQIPNPSP